MLRPPLLVLTPGFPLNETESYIVPAVQNWVEEANKYFDIRVITFQYPYHRHYYTWNNIPCFAAGGNNCRFPYRFITWMRIVWQMLRWHKEKPFALINSFWLTETTFIGGILQKKLNIPHFAWIQGQDARPTNSYLRYLPYKNLHIISISEFVTKEFQHTNRKIKSMIPMGLPMMPPVIQQNPSIDILGVGNLIPLKRWDIFIHIIDKLRTDFPNIQATIIGIGESFDLLYSQIQSLGLQAHVQILGRMPRAEVWAHLQKSKILFQPSEYEGQGLAMLEGLASGCQVVAREVGGVPHHPHLHLCNHQDDMEMTLRTLLHQPLERKLPTALWTMSDTIVAFRELYQNEDLELKPECR